MTRGILSPEQQQALLALARDTVTEVVRRGRPGESLPAPQGLDRPCGAFVTLTARGALRGCIGTFEPLGTLWETVRAMAVAAATRDPRFFPVEEDELSEIDIEISVLSELTDIKPQQVEIGRHGLEISRGGRRGVLLPQVAVEHDMDRDTFLSETCRKAGLPLDDWKDPGTRLRGFEAEVFGERRAS